MDNWMVNGNENLESPWRFISVLQYHSRGLDEIGLEGYLRVVVWACEAVERAPNGANNHKLQLSGGGNLVGEDVQLQRVRLSLQVRPRSEELRVPKRI